MPAGTRKNRPDLPWHLWFALRRFRLVRGVHYHGETRTFAQTVRNAASRRGASVSLRPGTVRSPDPADRRRRVESECLDVSVVGPADLSPPKPKGFASPKQKDPRARRAPEAEG